MYLYELVDQKKVLDIKIQELKVMLEVDPKDEIAKELLDLLEIRQAKVINISLANSGSNITIGNTKTTVTAAVVVRDTIKSKIDILTNIINSDNSLDKLSLIRQRDKYFEEYTFIDMAIKRNDLTVTLG